MKNTVIKLLDSATDNLSTLLRTNLAPEEDLAILEAQEQLLEVMYNVTDGNWKETNSNKKQEA